MKYLVGGLTALVLLMAAYLMLSHTNAQKADFAASEAVRVQHMGQMELKKDPSPAAKVELQRRFNEISKQLYIQNRD
jgi:hypothetical protein